MVQGANRAKRHVFRRSSEDLTPRVMRSCGIMGADNPTDRCMRIQASLDGVEAPSIG